jgi:hypothetical protein
MPAASAHRGRQLHRATGPAVHPIQQNRRLAAAVRPRGGNDGYFDVWVAHGIFIRYVEQNVQGPDRPKLIHEAPVGRNFTDPENSLPQLAFGR